MSDHRLYHNPNCSKSRGALELLQARDLDFETIEYLETPLDAATLGQLLDLLACDPGELVRKDKKFKELGLDEARYSEGADREAVITLLIEHPVLMTRPIFIAADRAIIGRPSERVLELL